MNQEHPYIYLRGILECQFHARPGDRALGSFERPNEIELQPRFRFTGSKKVAAVSLSASSTHPNLESDLDAQSWIFHKEPTPVEFEEGDDFIKRMAFGIWFLQDDKHALSSVNSDGSWIPVTWQELAGQNFVDTPAARGLEQDSFKAAGYKGLHGRMKGSAIIRILDPSLPEERVCAFVNPNNLNTCPKILRDDQPLFCDTHKFGKDPSLGIGNTGKKGCAPGGAGALPSLINGPASGAGQACWPSSSGCMGCSSSLWQLGCGLLSLLLALLLALWFIWCVLLGNCADQQNENSTTTPPDTVYVEVVKEIKDTLKIIQRDTIAFIDSTKEESYLMVALPNVQFYTDQAVLLPSSSMELATVAEYMNQHPEATAAVFGHTDSVGNDQHNMDLSQRRAEAVRTFLMSLGVDGGRITAKGYGETRPKASNSTPEGRLMNRRVEMKLSQPTKIESNRHPVPNNSNKNR